MNKAEIAYVAFTCIMSEYSLKLFQSGEQHKITVITATTNEKLQAIRAVTLLLEKKHAEARQYASPHFTAIASILIATHYAGEWHVKEEKKDERNKTEIKQPTHEGSNYIN